MGVEGDLKRNEPFNLVEEELLITSCPRFVLFFGVKLTFHHTFNFQILGALDIEHSSVKTAGVWSNVYTIHLY